MDTARASVLNKNIQTFLTAAHHSASPSESLTFLHRSFLAIDDLIDIQEPSDAPSLWELETIRNYILSKIRDASQLALPDRDVLELCGLDEFPSESHLEDPEDSLPWSYSTAVPNWPELARTEALMRSMDAALPADAFMIRMCVSPPFDHGRAPDRATQAQLLVPPPAFRIRVVKLFRAI